MKIGLVVHGPEVVDSGGCKHILNSFQNHSIIAKLGGIMGKTAIIDAELEDIIDIKESKRPSEQIDELFTKNFDLLIILNHGKTFETGIAFGGALISNSKRFSEIIPVIQIERPMEEDGAIFAWNESGKKILNDIEKIIKIPILSKPVTIPSRFKTESGKNFRMLVGVKPNEKIFLNNVIIGYSKSDNVTIIEKDGKIIDLLGGVINPHGLEKLKKRINLKTAMIKTAKVLRKITPEMQRIIEKTLKTNKIAILFNAENVYDIILKNVDLIISVGDDTTAIIADSASRFNIPIFGITDGDMDCLLNSIEKDFTINELGKILSLAPNSTLIRVKSGWDDKIGELIQSSIFKGKEIIEIKKEKIPELKEKILNLISEYIVSKYEKL